MCFKCAMIDGFSVIFKSSFQHITHIVICSGCVSQPLALSLAPQLISLAFIRASTNSHTCYSDKFVHKIHWMNWCGCCVNIWSVNGFNVTNCGEIKWHEVSIPSAHHYLHTPLSLCHWLLGMPGAGARTYTHIKWCHLIYFRSLLKWSQAMTEQ